MSEGARGPNWRKSTYSNAQGDCVEVGLTWRKSTHSNGTGNCLEVATETRAVLIRDTTNRSGATLTVPAQAWRVLLTKVRAS